MEGRGLTHQDPGHEEKTREDPGEKTTPTEEADRSDREEEKGATQERRIRGRRLPRDMGDTSSQVSTERMLATRKGCFHRWETHQAAMLRAYPPEGNVSALPAPSG